MYLLENVLILRGIYLQFLFLNGRWPKRKCKITKFSTIVAPFPAKSLLVTYYIGQKFLKSHPNRQKTLKILAANLQFSHFIVNFDVKS